MTNMYKRRTFTVLFKTVKVLLQKNELIHIITSFKKDKFNFLKKV